MEVGKVMATLDPGVERVRAVALEKWMAAEKDLAIVSVPVEKARAGEGTAEGRAEEMDLRSVDWPGWAVDWSVDEDAETEAVEAMGLVDASEGGDGVTAEATVDLETGED